MGASAFDADSVFSADESKSPRGSPERPTAYESPSKEYSEDHFRKSSEGDAETHRFSFSPYTVTLLKLSKSPNCPVDFFSPCSSFFPRIAEALMNLLGVILTTMMILIQYGASILRQVILLFACSYLLNL